MEMKDIFNNKFTDQVSLTNDFLVPDVSNYLQINETEIEASAKKIIKSARSYNSYNAFEKLMHEYDLSSSEGIVLMCLAEALLRIPDNKTINDLIEDIPLKRLGSVQDISDLVIFLSSEDASYITGQTISVDGGLFMY